ncbi:hypothetical protein FA15DRAFT_664677 [Coprinopsis marcescibilis]|uniref:Protein YOP1 n=1 Tax=Coprinopsis marcescibilis TaxID=230819 RepID=A0A5C3L7N6_COPMA|nr:hypothetical protein FA15DRAFT_664677 [Coprinopsis marcescibilis]
MPLFVPVLRGVMLFMNVYESYKTLKPPPPSTRNPTRPSVRAATQRKRDLKGCMAIWIVWCSFALYERFIESIVNLFIPFYDEFKSLAMLFLILTRARGAEPIFLHVLRPLIRPYDSTIDGTLDVLRMTGDFVFALASFPVHLGLKWLHSRYHLYGRPESDVDSGSESGANQAADMVFADDPSDEVAGLTQRSSDSIDVTPKRNPPPRRGSADTIQASSRITDGGASTQSIIRRSPQTRAQNGAQAHEIWHPPRSAYDDAGSLTTSPNLSNMGSPPALQQSTVVEEIEEWRKYPAFPSAYPPTPLTTTSHLAMATAAMSSQLFAPIPEEPHLLPRQDFRRSLKQPRKPLDPGFADDLSDYSDQPVGIHHFHSFTGTSATAVDSEDDNVSDDTSYDEEDSFDKTLRTPLQPYGSLRSRALPQALPLSSFPSQSTAVNSVDTASSLRTRALSDAASSPVSPSDSFSGASSAMEMEATAKPGDIKPQARRLDSTMPKNKERQPLQPQRRTRPRPSPVKKRKVSRPQPLDDGTSTTASDFTADDDAEPSSAEGKEGAKDFYVPGDQKVRDPKRRRVIGATTAPRKIPASATSTRAVSNSRVPRRPSPNHDRTRSSSHILAKDQAIGTRAGPNSTLSRKPSRITRSKADNGLMGASTLAGPSTTVPLPQESGSSSGNASDISRNPSRRLRSANVVT